MSFNATIKNKSFDRETLGRVCGTIAKAAQSGKTASTIVETTEGPREIVFEPGSALIALAEFLDDMSQEARRKRKAGVTLTRFEKGLLRFLQERAPSTFSGMRTSKGRRLLLPISAAFTYSDNPTIWLNIADDLSLYEDIMVFGPETHIGSGISTFYARLKHSPLSNPNYFSTLARLISLDEAGDD